MKDQRLPYLQINGGLTDGYSKVYIVPNVTAPCGDS